MSNKKKCKTCEEKKELSLFKKDKKVSSGYSNLCKKCHSQKSKERYAKNKEKILEKQRSKRTERVKNKIYNSNYKNCTKCLKIKPTNSFYKDSNAKFKVSPQCKDCINIKAREYRQKNSEKIKLRYKKYREKNLEKDLESSRLWRENNPEQARKNLREYYKKNKDIYVYHAALRRALKSKATPKWLSKKDKDQIKKIYKKAKYKQKNDNIEYHVDHIVPLNNKKVCGLHVHWNLQIITKEENLKKKNKLM